MTHAQQNHNTRAPKSMQSIHSLDIPLIDYSDSTQPIEGQTEVTGYPIYKGWAWLICIDHKLSNQLPSSVIMLHPIIKSTILLGSTTETCDLVFASGRISREHATIDFDLASGRFSVTDRSSTNGSFLQLPGGLETRVVGREMLADQARIRLADEITLLFRCFSQKVVRP